MRSINTETELVLTITEEEFDKLKSFLESLNLVDGNEEILDFWLEEGVWNIESLLGNFLVILGKSQIHAILRKNENFEKLRDELLKFVNF